MAIVLKSNVVATKSLGHMSGIAGPMDYSGMIDFVNRKMIEDNVEKDIFSANSLTVLNVSAAHYLSIYDPISNTLTKKLSQNNLATHLDYLGEKGLVAYGYTSNWMADADGYLTATKTRMVGVTATNKLVTLQVFGAGSVTLSGSVLDQGEGLTATYEKPVTVLVTGSNPTVTATVSGSVLHYQVLAKNKIYKNVAIAYTGQNLSVYTKALATPKSQCSFIFNAKIDDFDTFNHSPYQFLFALKFATDGYFSFTIQGEELRVAITGRSAWDSTPLTLGNNTIVATVNGANLKAFINGKKICDYTAPSNLEVSSVDFVKSGANPSHVFNGLNGTIKKLVTYSRAVSDAEAIQMTNSFKF